MKFVVKNEKNYSKNILIQHQLLFMFIFLLSFLGFTKSTDESLINISNYTYPKLSELPNDETIIAILGTNDIHGQAYERDFKMTNDSFKLGGYKLLSGAIKSIREEFKSQFLWLDAGDQFTGTVENIKSTGQIMVDFYNALRVDSVAIGNHEWDNKESQLKKWMANELGRYYNLENSFFSNAYNTIKLDKTDKNNNVGEIIKKPIDHLQIVKTENQGVSFLQKKSFSNAILGNLEFSKNNNEFFGLKTNFKQTKNNLYLAANLKLKDNFNSTTDDLPNKMSSKMFEFLNGKIKIGVIGLITIETNEKTSGFPNNKFDLMAYKPTVERLSKELKSKGANAVIIVSHVGMTCKSPLFSPEELQEYYKLALRDKDYYNSAKNSKAPQNSCKGEMFNLLSNLEIGTVQAVIAGHVHESIHHFINGIPVIQNPMSNIFTNVLYLKFKKDENGNYVLKTDDALIEGPIPLCSKVYTNNFRCNVYQELTENIKISDFIFHNKKFEVDPQVEKVFEKHKNITELIEKMKINTIFNTELHMERSFVDENLLGNLVADIYRELTKSDIGMVAPGNLRYIWEPGPVSEYEFNNMFPFGGNFGRYNVTGANLKKIFQILQQGESGYYAFSGVNMTILRTNDTYSKLLMDSIKLWNGEDIQDDKLYSFASNEFELNGGDDMKNFVKDGKITVNSTEIENSLPILENFTNYLKNIKVLRLADAYKYMGRLNVTNLMPIEKSFIIKNKAVEGNKNVNKEVLNNFYDNNNGFLAVESHLNRN